MQNSTKISIIVPMAFLLALSLSMAIAEDACTDLRACVENCSTLHNCSEYLNCIENCTQNATFSFRAVKENLPWSNETVPYPEGQLQVPSKVFFEQPSRSQAQAPASSQALVEIREFH